MTAPSFFSTIVVMSLCIRLLYSDTGRFASLLPHYGVMLGSIRKVTQGSCCWKHYLGSLFLALCKKVATPGIWCMHVYVSWKRSGYCTVLHFSRPPSSFSLCVRLHWSCQGFTLFSCPLVCVRVCVCVWQGRREVWIKPEAEREREKCKHCTNPVLLISEPHDIWPKNAKGQKNTFRKNHFRLTGILASS